HPPQPRPPLFPYTTLFRSDDERSRLATMGGATMTPAAAAELRPDVHSIEPIPEKDKDSTGPQQMWIWAGANIAPINWALGALGIDRKSTRLNSSHVAISYA